MWPQVLLSESLTVITHFSTPPQFLLVLALYTETICPPAESWIYWSAM